MVILLLVGPHTLSWEYVTLGPHQRHYPWLYGLHNAGCSREFEMHNSWNKLNSLDTDCEGLADSPRLRRTGLWIAAGTLDTGFCLGLLEDGWTFSTAQRGIVFETDLCLSSRSRSTWMNIFSSSTCLMSLAFVAAGSRTSVFVQLQWDIELVICPALGSVSSSLKGWINNSCSQNCCKERIR